MNRDTEQPEEERDGLFLFFCAKKPGRGRAGAGSACLQFWEVMSVLK